MTELFSEIAETRTSQLLTEKYKGNEEILSLLRENAVIRFKDTVLNPVINTKFELSSYTNETNLCDLNTFNEYYYWASKSIYGTSPNCKVIEENAVNWVKQSHIFKPFYDSSYVVSYFLSFSDSL
ncbi:peptidase M3 [Bombiscardovia coagulans]|uniref:Peptidase M3 n=1 Tax=Bombiscardovia coagulans TaxID=686666 RepID=A0A261EQ50_9BIFI|nr:peptidase M3 [Bombiscardovia coagulans]